MKKKSITLLAILLVTGGVIGIGFLSFTGALLVSPLVAIAIGSFAFSVVIEGEVYKKNVSKGLKKLFSKNDLAKAIAQRELNKLLENPANKPQSEFLRDYEKLDTYVKELKLQLAQKDQLTSKERQELRAAKDLFLAAEKNLSDIKAKLAKQETPLTKDQNAELDHAEKIIILQGIKFLDIQKRQNEERKVLIEKTEKDLALAKKKLELKQKYFYRYLYEGGYYQNDPHAAELNQLLTEDKKEELKNELKIKTRLRPIAGVLSIGSGIACTLSSFSFIQGGCLTLMKTFALVLGPTLLSGGIIAAGIVAGLCYAGIMYYCVSNFIDKNQIHKAWLKLKDFWNTKNTTDKPVYFWLKAIGLGLVIFLGLGLCIFGTVATAGTIWPAVVHGAKLIPHFAKIARLIVRGVTVPMLGLSVLLFNLKNSFGTLKKIRHLSLTRGLKKIRDDIINTWKEETVWEFINPFRMLSLVVEIVISIVTAIGHFLSEGATADQLPKVPTLATFAGTTAYAGAVDTNSLMEDPNKNSSHHHGKIVEIALKFIFFIPLYLPSAIWAYLACPEERRPRSFLGQLKITLGITKKFREAEIIEEVKKPIISERSEMNEDIQLFRKEEKRLSQAYINTELSGEKRETLEAIRAQLEKSIPIPTSQEEGSKDKKAFIEEILRKTTEEKLKSGDEILRTHRYSFLPGEKLSRSEKFLDKMLANQNYRIRA